MFEGAPVNDVFADGRRSGIEAALKIIDDWRAREDEWKERAKNGDVHPRVDRARLLEDASTREAVLRGAAADIRELLKDE